MPKAKEPPPKKVDKTPDTGRPLNRAEMEHRMANHPVPCPGGCGREATRKLLIPYGGNSMCAACFVEASKLARYEARKASVPLFMRAQAYASMAYGWRMRRSGCGCGSL